MNILETLIKRWTSNSPKLFKNITNISLAITIIVGIPSLANTFQEELCKMSELTCFDFPAWWDGFWAKALPITTMVSGFISKLTATSADKRANNIED